MGDLHGDYPVLYSFRRCPFAMRARMALMSAGRTCELREVLLRDKPAPMIEISAKATVPVLSLQDGTVLEESIEIMHWALSQNDPEGLLDLNAREREASDALLQLVDGAFKFHLDRYKYASRYEECDPLYHREQAEKILQEFDSHLQDSDWLFGDRPKFADIACLPFVRQYRIADPRWFDEEMPLPAVRGWLHRFLQTPWFAAVMEKYPPWQEEKSELVLFPAPRNGSC